MAGPITWRNVTGPSLADASRPLEVAQRTISGAFDSFGNVLQRQQDVADRNWDQVKENNTQDFLNKIYSAQGAEGFKALQDSGELDRMLAANGAQIDRAAARSAMDGRLTTLQNRDMAGITYKNTMLDEAQAADVRRIGLLTLTDPAAAQAELAAKPELRAAVQLAQGIDNRQQELKNRVWNEQKQAWETAEEAQKVITRPLEVKKLESGLKTDQVNRSLTAAQTNRINNEIANDAADRETKRNRDILTNALKDNRYNEGVLVPGGSADLIDLITKNNIGDDKGWWNDAPEKRGKIIERIEKLARTGYTVDIPDQNNPGQTIKATVPFALKDVKAALLSATDKNLSWNEGWADSFEQNLLRNYRVDQAGVAGRSGRIARGGVTPGSRAAAPGQVISPIVQDFQAYQGIMQNGINAVPAPKPKK
jgi:hypothetical protein